MNNYIFEKMFLKLLHGKKCIVDQSSLLYNFVVKLKQFKNNKQINAWYNKQQLNSVHYLRYLICKTGLIYN